MKPYAKIVRLILLGTCIAMVAEATHGETAAAKSAKAKYTALVQRARSGDQTVDLNELRLAAGEANIESDVDARDNLMTAARNHDFKKMETAANAVLKSNFADLDGHYFARIAAKELGKPEQAEFHHWVEFGLLKSLRGSGDGKSAATAMKVISVEEEYFLLRMMDQQPGKQALSTCNGDPCDIMTTYDPESKQEITWYFNVAIPMRHLSESLGGTANTDAKH